MFYKPEHGEDTRHLSYGSNFIPNNFFSYLSLT